jgi:hypothetical protein
MSCRPRNYAASRTFTLSRLRERSSPALSSTPPRFVPTCCHSDTTKPSYAPAPASASPPRESSILWLTTAGHRVERSTTRPSRLARHGFRQKLWRSLASCRPSCTASPSPRAGSNLSCSVAVLRRSRTTRKGSPFHFPAPRRPSFPTLRAKRAGQGNRFVAAPKYHLPSMFCARLRPPVRGLLDGLSPVRCHRQVAATCSLLQFLDLSLAAAAARRG